MKIYTLLFASMSLLFWPLAALAEYVLVDPQQIEGMILLGQESALDPTGISGLSMKGNYLYCTSQWGLHTVDVSDPTNMQFAILGEWDSGGTKVQGVGHYGETLYAANWSPGVGLRVFDITQPAFPALIRTKSTVSSTWTLGVFDGLMFIELSNSIDDIFGINIYDVAANPTNPPLASYVAGPGRGINNAVKYQNYMYFSCQRWVFVYDITDPYNPVYVRRISFNAEPLNSGIGRDNNLYVLARDHASYGSEHGFYSFSLADPSNPQQLDYLDNVETDSKFFHLHDVLDAAYVVGGGGSIYTVDISDPSNMSRVRHWSVDWPDPYHPGWTSQVTGAGEYIYVGTVQGTDANCADFTCPWYGARVYAVRVANWVGTPPIIAEVIPDPDAICVEHAYIKQLTLLQGDPPITWSVVQGPVGLQVDQNGYVSGWTPSADDLGNLVDIEIRAGNGSGSDTESWQVKVLPLPEGTLSLFTFDAGEDGWTLATWKSGSYEPGTVTWASTGGNPYGNIRSTGSGSTNTNDSCTREGSTMTREISTKGYVNIRIEYDVISDLYTPPNSGCTGTCTSGVLEGTCQDKLVVYYRMTGTSGPWTPAQMLSEGVDLPSTWTRQVINLQNDPGVINNPNFTVRFNWQFNTENDKGFIDNVSIHGSQPAAFRANADGDNDVDQEDFGQFQVCYSGSGIPLGEGCDNFDFDHDCDVDVTDFNTFQLCMSGTNMPIDLSCAE